VARRIPSFARSSSRQRCSARRSNLCGFPKQAIKKPKGTISVQPQLKYKQPGLKTEDGTDAFAGVPECDMLAGHAYEAGAGAVMVPLSPNC
jgi:hypothetical protein